MPTSISRFANDIVSLTVLALMVVALIAGQAGATPPSAHSETIDDTALAEHVIRIDHQAKRRSEDD
jgi:hypothetical protein